MRWCNGDRRYVYGSEARENLSCLEGDRIMRSMKTGGLALILIVSVALVGCSGSGSSVDARLFGIWSATAAWINGTATANIAGAWGYDEFGNGLQVVFLNTGRCSDQAYNAGEPIGNEAGSWTTSNRNVTIDWDSSGRKVYGYEFSDADKTCRLTFATASNVIVVQLAKQ